MLLEQLELPPCGAPIQNQKKKIFLIGGPAEYPGANSEALHTVVLWRMYGVDVNIVPTFSIDPDISRLLVTKYNIRIINVNDLKDIPGLDENVVISFCNRKFLEELNLFKSRKCITIWAGCMTKLMDYEISEFQKFGLPDYLVFQSEFQKQQILHELKSFNIDLPEDRYFKIVPSFIKEFFPFQFRPHFKNQPFYVGRAARPAHSKWPADLIVKLSRVPQPLFCILMGLDRSTKAMLGFQPPWVACLKPQSMDMRTFYSLLHCYIATNGTAKENWPRVGLEAMSSGVPLVVLKNSQDGWDEMIKHGETGFICGSDDEFVDAITELSNNEERRLKMVAYAREYLNVIANEAKSFASWKLIFEKIGALEPN